MTNIEMAIRKDQDRWLTCYSICSLIGCSNCPLKDKYKEGESCIPPDSKHSKRNYENEKILINWALEEVL